MCFSVLGYSVLNAEHLKHHEDSVSKGEKCCNDSDAIVSEQFCSLEFSDTENNSFDHFRFGFVNERTDNGAQSPFSQVTSTAGKSTDDDSLMNIDHDMLESTCDENASKPLVRLNTNPWTEFLQEFDAELHVIEQVFETSPTQYPSQEVSKFYSDVNNS